MTENKRQDDEGENQREERSRKANEQLMMDREKEMLEHASKAGTTGIGWTGERGEGTCQHGL